jgi:hypothetical protein
MNSAVENLFQTIGNHILGMVGDSSLKALAYAEAQEGVISVGVFYQAEEGATPVFKFGERELSDLFYSLWQEWAKENGGESWKAVTYLIQHGKPKLEVVYSDKFDHQMSKLDRRTAIVEKNFGSSKIDYSHS